MTGPAAAASHGRSARDVVVTGMGFCLPGYLEPVFNTSELWSIASRGGCCLIRDEIYYGSVNLTDAMFEERVPDVHPLFGRHYTNAHRFGLVSMIEACTDAGLDFRAGDLSEAGILAGRAGIDANVPKYMSALQADPEQMGALEAVGLFIGGQLCATPSDVALVLGGLTRSTGPCFTVSCGCASSAVQIGNARRMIATGEVDIAVVTGVDLFDTHLMRHAQRLLRDAQESYSAIRMPDMPELLPTFDSLMRPYDQRADRINHGEGAATLILESRAHAERRGAHVYGQVLSSALTRDGLSNPVTADDSGKALVAAVRTCLGDRWRIEQVPYVRGGSDGNVVVTSFEANAIRELYGPDSGLLMTSQEACFGHNGAPAGCVGVALTLLMMELGEVCPTANCERPDPELPFDPVPGLRTRPLDFDYALVFNYQIGGAKHAILLGSPEAE